MTRVLKNILITALIITSTSTISFAKQISSVIPQNYVVAKDAEVLPSKTQTYLQNQNSEKVKIWVFYRDKGFSDKNSFLNRASSIEYSEKVLKRRKKAGINEILFVDLPVVQNYVTTIEQLGATHRRDSKWLNASSFEVSLDKLQEIEQLDFVKSIKPMVGFKKEKEYPNTINDDIGINNKNQSPLRAAALNYGSSLVQLQQINVPAVHQKGYTGAGVTLCLTDTGFRKSHSAFAAAYADNRVLAEYDFIFNDSNVANEPIDISTQWDHGTLIWSVSAGKLDGSIYGPAYNANLLLAKTEDVRSETPVEEDNWVAALEWADSLGADVISTSLGYSDWYNSSQFDGNTATITLAANTCASLGIVLCNSMGNEGPGATTLSPPADAFDIIAVGAVNSAGTIASFSSRGPSADGRTKPEVCAMGVGTYSASSSGDNNFTTANGTSLSTPLVAGATCLLVEARPTFSPQYIRQALMETADNANSPNNNYGWGVIDIDAALGWGANIQADSTIGNAPLNVSFTGSSPLTVTSWLWDFGDGNTSTMQNPSHTYTVPGLYNVSLTVDSEAGLITNTQEAYVAALGDTMQFIGDSTFAGHTAVLSVSLTNSQPLSEIHVPYTYFDSPKIINDSVTLGSRTSYFEDLSLIAVDSWNKKYTYRLKANSGGGSPDLPAGSGEILKIYFTINEWELGGLSYLVDTTTSPYALELSSPALIYGPVFQNGSIKTTNVLRGDLTYDFNIDISDLVSLVNYMFTSGPAPLSKQMGDLTGDKSIDISDLTYMVDYMFTGGPPPVNP